jgi:iron complex outermembrane recepter protein
MPVQSSKSLLFLALLTSAIATAAENPDAISTITVTASKLRSLDQVAETGSRLGLSQRETPATLDVVDADQIIGRGLQSVRMAVETMPGVSTGGSPGDPAEISMRGFTSGQIMVLFDGIYVGESVLVNRPGNSFNLERVEVLKGPASVLYGYGGIGGVVNTVSKMPNFDGPSTDLLASFGTFGKTNIGIGTGFQLSDTLAFRGDVSRTSSDGYVEGMSEDAVDASLSFRWRPSERLDTRLKLDFFRDHPSPYFGTPLVPPSFAQQPLGGIIQSNDGRVIDERMREIGYNVADYRLEARQFWPKLFVDYTLSDKTAIKAYAYFFDAERTWQNAENYVFNPATSRIDRDRFIVTHDQRMRGGQVSLTRKGEVFSRKNTFVVGLDYNKTDWGRTRGFVAADSVDPLNPSLGTFGSVPLRSLPTFWTSESLFLENVFDVTEDFKLILGGRHDRLDLDRQNFNFDGSFNPTTSFRRDYKTTNGRLGLVYNINKNLTPYLSYSLGSDPPTNASLLSMNRVHSNADFTFSQQIEAGIKGNTEDNLLDYTVAAYYIERNDILMLVAIDTLAQAGKQSSRGLEVTTNARITPNWTISINAAYVDAQFDEFIDSGAGNVSGNRPANVPEWVGNIWTSVRNVFGVPLELGGGVRYLGDRFGNHQNTFVQKAYTLVDAYASYPLTDNVLATARIKNVLDEDYVAWADIFYPNQVILGEPRSYQLDVVVKF